MPKVIALIKGYTNSYRGLSTNVWFGITINLAQSMAAGIFYFLSYYFVKRLGYTPKTAGMLISFYGVGAVIGGFLGGKAADYLNAKVASYVSLFLQAIVFLILLNSTLFTYLAISVFLFGLTNYSFITSNYLWTLSHCRNNTSTRLKTINILAVISNLGLSISAIYIPAIPSENYTHLFYIDFIVLVSLAILVLLKKDIETPIEDVVFMVEPQGDNIRYNHSHFKTLCLVYLSVFFIGLIVAQMSSTYSLYLGEKFPEYGVSGFGFLFSLNTLLVVFLQTPVGEVFTRQNQILTMGFGCLLIGIGMGVLAISTILSFVILSCILYTFGEMIFFSIAQLICYEKANSENKGKQLGIFRMVYASTRIFGPLAGGYVYSSYSGEYIWYFACVAGIILFAVCYLNKSEANISL